MPGFTIHIAIASEYIKKHKSEITNENEFFEGTIAPDLVKDKYKSHYGNYAEKHIGVYNFLNTTDIDITTDYGKGYFMHLLADEAFYHSYFKEERDYIEREHKDFYKDYDYLNEIIINEYNITYIPKNISKNFKKIKGEPSILKVQKVKDFINKLSEISIEEQIKKINEKNEVII